MQDNSTNRASRAFLVAAVLLGALAMVLAFVYLNQQGGGNQAPVNIVVAKHDLSPAKPIDPAADLMTEEVPARFHVLVDRGITAQTMDSLRGQRVNRKILGGTPLMPSDFSTASDLELAPGHVVLSIPVKGANALSGLLVPGDIVKVLVTRPIVRLAAPGAAAVGAGTPQWESVEIAAAVRVVAVGSRLVRFRQQFSAAEQYDTSSQSDNNQTVTLEVTEQQAKNILEQTGAGQLPITLILMTKAGAAETPTTAR